MDSNSVRFWTAICVGLSLKFLFAEKMEGLTKAQVRKRALAGIVAGASAAFYGTDHVVAYFSVKEESYLLVVIGLAFTGEHIVRTFAERGPAIGSATVDALVRVITKGGGK